MLAAVPACYRTCRCLQGPEAVLAYLSRYTHRVAISNRRLIAFDKTGVTFRYKDYRHDGPERPMAGVRKPSPSVTLGPVTASWLLWLRPSALLLV